MCTKVKNLNFFLLDIIKKIFKFSFYILMHDCGEKGLTTLANWVFEGKSKTSRERVEEANGRRVTHLGIETCYNGARRRGNESITSRKQLGEGSRCLGINSEKALETSQ